METVELVFRNIPPSMTKLKIYRSHTQLALLTNDLILAKKAAYEEKENYYASQFL